MKAKAVLILAVIVGLLAAVLTHSYLSAKDGEVEKMKAEIQRRYAKIEVLCAKTDIPSGTILSAENLGIIEVFENSVRDHVVSGDEYRIMLGRKTVRKLQRGAPIFWSDIDGGNPADRGLSREIKTGMRALSVNVSGAAAVSGMVRPNDRVDVLGTFTFPSKENPEEAELVTLTMLQDVQVLATGRETAKSLLLGDGRPSGNYSTATLLVTPREAEMLVFAEQIKGRLALSLRNPDDVHYEKELPRIDFKKIQSEIEELNLHRQRRLLHKTL